jgi:hypothetical protein
VPDRSVLRLVHARPPGEPPGSPGAIGSPLRYQPDHRGDLTSVVISVAPAGDQPGRAHPIAARVPVERNLFDLLCDELAFDRSTVQVIRVNPREASVTWTEPSGMPRSTTYRFERTGGRDTEAAV